MALASRIALVTGAGSGLGRATAARFVAAGARVALLDLPQSPVADVAKQLGKGCVAVHADVTNEEQVRKAIAAAVAELGGLNAVVQCAGIAPAAKILSKRGPHALDLFAKVLTVNTIGTFNVMRLAAESMATRAPDAEGERGVIVNTASIAAFEGQVGQCAYSASKAAVVGMMMPAARELAKSGIRINTIAPGVFLTPMVEAFPQEVQAKLASTIPFPSRLGRADDFAALAEHIVINRYINSEVIRIDGALRMQE